jgi:hypothetical protein
VTMVFIVLLTAAVNIVVTLQTKTAIQENRPRSYYENRLDKMRDARVVRVERDTTINGGL